MWIWAWYWKAQIHNTGCIGGNFWIYRGVAVCAELSIWEVQRRHFWSKVIVLRTNLDFLPISHIITLDRHIFWAINTCQERYKTTQDFVLYWGNSGRHKPRIGDLVGLGGFWGQQPENFCPVVNWQLVWFRLAPWWGRKVPLERPRLKFRVGPTGGTPHNDPRRRPGRCGAAVSPPCRGIPPSCPSLI